MPAAFITSFTKSRSDKECPGGHRCPRGGLPPANPYEFRVVLIRRRPKIILLGMMARQRVSGAVWATLHYLIGLEKLGYEAYYVEAHGAVPWAFQQNDAGTAEFIESILRGFDMADRWAFHSRSADGTY